MNYIEFLHNRDKYKGEDHSAFLEHYGILGQKWGQRRWQNADGTFNEAGKERYFGKSSSSEEKVGSAKSEAKDYLKFRNKMLKKRTRPDLREWYLENHKQEDKQFVKNAKKVDKAREKMYKDQLKDFYDDPNELVADLKNVYKISGSGDKYKEIDEKYPRGGYDLTNNQLYSENEQEYLNDKKVAKTVNKIAQEVYDGNYEKYNKLMNKVDEEHKDTIRRAAEDVAESMFVYNHRKEMYDISKNLGLEDHNTRQILDQRYDDDERVYDIPDREMILKNIDTIKKAMEKDNVKDYYDEIYKFAKTGEQKDAVDQFVDDVISVKHFYDQGKELNKELQNSKNLKGISDHPIEFNIDSTDLFYSPYTKDTRSIQLKAQDPENNKGKKIVQYMDKNINKYIDQIKDQVVENLYEDYKDWHADDSKILSKQEFKNQIGKINSGSVDNNGFLQLYFYDNDLFYGHYFSTESVIDDNGNLKVRDAYIEG